MNKQRRQRLQAVIDGLTKQKCELEEIRDEEQEYYDNMPENLQGSSRGEQTEETIDALDEAIDSLDDIMEAIDDIINSN